VDLEIENTLLRLRKEARVNTMAVEQQQTLKELATPNVESQPLCINIDNHYQKTGEKQRNYRQNLSVSNLYRRK
jgi:imidazole glycerol phosphate synthase subunit HisF